MRTSAIVLMLVCASVATMAGPPSQSELPRQALTRLPAEARTELESRIGVGFDGFGEHGVLLGGSRDAIASFGGRVAVIQYWTLRDANAQRAVTLIGEALDGVEGVVIVALHPKEEQERVQRVLDRRAMPGHVLIDDGSSLCAAFGFGDRGGNVLVDRHGAIRYAGIEPGAMRDLIVQLSEETPDPALRPKVALGEFASRRASASGSIGEIERALASGNVREAEQLVDALWSLHEGTAAEFCRGLITSANPMLRPLGLESMMKKGSAQRVLEAIGGLDARANSAEVAFLVRSLGPKPFDNAEAVLKPFLESRSAMIRQAALYVLADRGEPQALGLFVKELRTAPAAKDNWGIKEADRLMSAMFGAAYTLSGMRADQGREYEQWLTEFSRDPARAAEVAKLSLADASGSPRSIRFGSDTFYTYPMFDATVRASDASQTGAEVIEILSRAAEQARDSAASVLGKVHMAPVRLYLADHRAFSSLASNSYMGGQAEVNRVILRIGQTSQMRQVMTHEYVHIVHSAMFERQPRWLSEGFAESVAAGSRPEPWDRERVRLLDIEKGVSDGVFSRLTGWSASASNDAREGENYRLSHLAVDFLRRGPFPAGDTRLGLLMASYSSGRNDRDAMTSAYGMDARQLDAAIRAWLGQ